MFEGLGKLEGEYAIKLQDNAKPFAVTTPRRVPIPLLEPVREELDDIESMGVISPTQKCTSMVQVQKKNGQVYISVNESLRENYTPYQRYSIFSCNWLELKWSLSLVQTRDSTKYSWTPDQLN